MKIVVGTRPQIIKLASLVKAFRNESIDFDIVHTGQHYDFEMDKVFFEELQLPTPRVHLGVGSGSHAHQTGTMVIRLEDALKGSDIVLVPGDTNSALAGGLAAVKMGVEVAHVEAGLRSRLHSMPEEINRILVDHLSGLLFAPTKTGYENLIGEGIEKHKVHLTGDVMADNIEMLRDRIGTAELPADLTKKGFAYITIHRAENVDDSESLISIVDTLMMFPDQHGLEAVFPVHPHTRKRLEDMNILSKLSSVPGLHLVKPVSYLTSLRLASEAKLVLTDSGGLQKEAFILGTPVVTLRSVTEWVETTETGWNIVAGLDSKKIKNAVKTFLDELPNPVEPMAFYGGGKASENIAGIVKKRVA